MSETTADKLRKQARAVYITADESVADSIAESLNAGAEAIDRLARLEAEIQAQADDWDSEAETLRNDEVRTLCKYCASRVRALLDSNDS